MKKLTATLFALLALATATVAQTRSGFVDGFDESNYAEITISEEKKNWEEVFKDKIKELDGQRFKIKCHFRYFNDFDAEFAFYSDGERFSIPMSGEFLFPDDMPQFTSLEIYYHHELYERKQKCYLINVFDGWCVVDDIRFVGQKYIATDALRIRDAPSLSASQVGRLKEGERATVLEVGEKVTIDGIGSAWVKVRTADGTEGWCFAGYLTDGTEYREKPWTSAE